LKRARGTAKTGARALLRYKHPHRRKGSTDMPHLALIRHGQSEWNLQNRFTGWVDVDLTPAGMAEAGKAGQLLAAAQIEWTTAYASVLKRAIRTLNLALDQMDLLWLPVIKDWRLNERHYGGLTGLDKAETAARHGDDQVKIWRRSYDMPPPPIAPGGPYDPARDRRYRGIKVPATESLKTTLDRVKPLWDSEIAPRLAGGDNLIVAAHGNSLRAIVKMILSVSDASIIDVEIPTGNPMLIEMSGDARRAKSARYLDAARATPIPSP
jgi:2,3-bisphosphoglycerate-dependent phosphoglycerate mutase